jgi:hypothetical protein
MNRKQITRDQAFHAIETGEFGADVIASNERVAVLLTQDWCSQFAAMKEWVYTLDRNFDLHELVYNQVSWFSEFRSFKEGRWKNGQIPYVRYYRDGKLVAESNYVSQEEFLRNLGF